MLYGDLPGGMSLFAGMSAAQISALAMAASTAPQMSAPASLLHARLMGDASPSVLKEAGMAAGGMAAVPGSTAGAVVIGPLINTASPASSSISLVASATSSSGPSSGPSSSSGGPSPSKMDGTPSTPDPDTIKMFVGQVPRGWNEMQCRELFEHYGPVYQLNILRDKQSQQSKGCCFVTYYHRKDAMAAQSDLHNIRTLAGMHHPIQMKPADSENRNERKLFIGMISKRMGEDEVRALFATFGLIEDCTVLRDGDGRSKGCAFVTFMSRVNAQAAIKAMHHSTIMEGCSTQMVVKFADTQKDKEAKLAGGPSTGSSSTGKGASVSPPATAGQAAVNQLLQPAMANNLLGILGGALLQHPQLAAAAAGQGSQANVLSLLGNVLTGLGRLSEAQSTGSPASTASSSSSTTAGASTAQPGGAGAEVNPALLAQHQQHQALLQQQRLIELSLIQQAQAAAVSGSAAKYDAGNATAALLQQQMLQAQAQQQYAAAAAQAPPSSPPNGSAAYGYSSPKDATALYQHQQAAAVAAAQAQQAQLLGLSGASAGYDAGYASQLQALGFAGLVPQVNMSQTSMGPSAQNIVGNGQSRGADGCNLFIYHLPQDFADSDLYNTFSPFGTVLSAKVFVDKQTNLSKCFGFVSYDNAQSAANAISGMNGFAIGTKRLKVQLKNGSARMNAHPYGGIPA